MPKSENKKDILSDIEKKLIHAHQNNDFDKAISFIDLLNTKLGESFSSFVQPNISEELDDDNYPLLDQHIPNGLKAISSSAELMHRNCTSDNNPFISNHITIPLYWLEDPFRAGERAIAELYRMSQATGSDLKCISVKIFLGNHTDISKKLAKYCSGLDSALEKFSLLSFKEQLDIQFDSDTPHISVSGLSALRDNEKAISNVFKHEDHHIYILGREHGHLGLSAYLNDAHHAQDGDCPSVQYTEEIKLGNFIREMNERGYLSSAETVSIGGIGLTLARMALPNKIGASVGGIGNASFWYGEDQARYIVTIKTADMAKFEVAAYDIGVSLLEIGNTEEDELSFNNQKIKLSEL